MTQIDATTYAARIATFNDQELRDWYEMVMTARQTPENDAHIELTSLEIARRRADR